MKSSDDVLLTMIITVYNLESYISECLDSIVTQKFDKNRVEVIIVNDGSTDSSESICKEYVSKYEYIKYIYQSNSGVSAARNNGLSNSNGKYVYMIDGDDILLNGSIEKILSIAASNYDIIQCKHIKFNDIKDISNKNNYSSNDEILSMSDLVKKNNFSSMALWSNIIKRDVIFTNSLSLNKNLKYTEDMDFFLEVLVKSKKIYLINKHLYGYRQNRSDSATMVIPKKRLDDSLFFIEKWLNRVSNDKTVALVKKQFMNFLCYQYLILLALYGKYVETNASDVEIENKLKQLRYLLKYSTTKKTMLASFVCKIIGLNNTTYLLKKYMSLR